ncbi:MAG: hypothetical protein HZA14_11095 [Nitrospirae bacterium]|nr:hypothetical protein [Nitrospirota bacterium]
MYKTILLTSPVIFFVLLLLHLRHYADYHTSLLSGVYIKDGASDLKANNWSVPVIYDWDDDGRKDLLVGNSFVDENKTAHGYVSFYKNIGPDSVPSFYGFIYLQTCGKECSALNAAAFG